MQRYIGTKIINAEPMNRQKYNDFRGWTLPENEDGNDEGYLVEYLDGGKPNTDKFEGYVSWSPKEQFEKAYRQSDALTFSLALEALKSGSKIARSGWNGKGQWLILVEAGLYEVAVGIINIYNDVNNQLTLRPWIGIKTVDDQFMPWLASQSDMLAEDWVILE
jgi:hypothetical protein